MKKEIIALMFIGALVVGFFIGYGIGYGKGSYESMILALKVAKNFMEVDFDEEMIAAGIFQYENRISGCFEENHIKPITFELQ